MIEWIVEALTTVSVVQVVGELQGWTVTDLVVLFLLSKPVFVIIAIGAVLGGRWTGDEHYLHFRACDRFLGD